MKRLFLLFAFILGMIANSFSQNYILVGESKQTLSSVFRFQVIDEFNNEPLKKFSVELRRGNYVGWKATTDDLGVFVLMVSDFRYFNEDWILKIYDPDYKYTSYEQVITRDDVSVSRKAENVLMLYVEDSRPVWWGSTQTPDNFTVAHHVSLGRYKIHNPKNSNLDYSGPEFFEKTIKLQYRRHPRDQKFVPSEYAVFPGKSNNSVEGNNISTLSPKKDTEEEKIMNSNRPPLATNRDFDNHNKKLLESISTESISVKLLSSTRKIINPGKVSGIVYEDFSVKVKFKLSSTGKITIHPSSLSKMNAWQMAIVDNHISSMKVDSDFGYINKGEVFFEMGYGMKKNYVEKKEEPKEVAVISSKDKGNYSRANFKVANREAIECPLPSPGSYKGEEGVIVVQVKIDKIGNIIEATPGVRGTTILNPQLLNSAKEAALHWKFNASELPIQVGTITYRFKSSDQVAFIGLILRSEDESYDFVTSFQQLVEIKSVDEIDSGIMKANESFRAGEIDYRERKSTDRMAVYNGGFGENFISVLRSKSFSKIYAVGFGTSSKEAFSNAKKNLEEKVLNVHNSKDASFEIILEKEL